jgi:hypothetical protein
MLYTVYFKMPGAKKWEEINDVEGDTLLVGDPNGPPGSFPVRVIYQKDHTRWEIPMSCLIRFSPERFDSIKKDMENRSGQTMKIKEN